MSETPTDPEISAILNYLRFKPQAEQAWYAMQQYKRQALGELPPGVARRQTADLLGKGPLLIISLPFLLLLPFLVCGARGSLRLGVGLAPTARRHPPARSG